MCAFHRIAIRDEALRLYAAHGPDAVSLRQVARAAGVSPALVVHHFGSRAGLKEAVDAHVGGVFDGHVAALAGADWSSAALGASLAEALVAALPPDSPVPAYLRRLLLSGDPAGTGLFARWYALARQAFDAFRAAGIVRPTTDPDVLAAFLMVNDLAVLLLRDQLRAVVGVDPLSGDGAARWTRVVLDAYRDAVFVPREET